MSYLPLIVRSDVDELAQQVSKVNSVLRKFCRQNPWKLIDHSNITVDLHLDRSRLHLNKNGTSRLARNFTDFINYFVG